MPLYRCTSYKRLNGETGEKWVNTYYLTGLVTSNVLDDLELIGSYEAAVMVEDCEVYRLAVKELPDGPTTLRSVSIPGVVVGDIANLVPMFNTIRVVFTDDVDRSESKYLRGRILEANVQGFNISGELQTEVMTEYVTPVLGMLALRGPNNETINSGSVQQVIQMRQLSWHRRTRPGFIRGWVPV